MKSITQHLKSLSVAGIFFVSLYTLYAWTGPSQLPPGGNVASPVNTGTLDQIKDGGLSVNAFSAFADSYFAGNVGIGTAGPSNKLDIGNNTFGQIGGANTVAVTVSTSTGRSYLSLGNNTNNRVQLGWNNTNETNLTGSWYADLTTVQTGNQPLVLQRSGGNVGIGTTTVQSALTVSSSANVTPLSIYGGGNTGVEIFRLYKSNGTEVMRMNSNGNLGIGVNTPNQKLDVAGNIQASGDVCTTANGGKCLSTIGGGNVASYNNLPVGAMAGWGSTPANNSNTGGGYPGWVAAPSCSALDPVFVNGSGLCACRSGFTLKITGLMETGFWISGGGSTGGGTDIKTGNMYYSCIKN